MSQSLIRFQLRCSGPPTTSRWF